MVDFAGPVTIPDGNKPGADLLECRGIPGFHHIGIGIVYATHKLGPPFGYGLFAFGLFVFNAALDTVFKSSPVIWEYHVFGLVVISQSTARSLFDHADYFTADRLGGLGSDIVINGFGTLTHGRTHGLNRKRQIAQDTLFFFPAGGPNIIVGQAGDTGIHGIFHHHFTFTAAVRGNVIQHRGAARANLVNDGQTHILIIYAINGLFGDLIGKGRGFFFYTLGLNTIHSKEFTLLLADLFFCTIHPLHDVCSFISLGLI